MMGQAVPCGSESIGERYTGKERWCFMATAAAGALLREAHECEQAQGSVRTKAGCPYLKWWSKESLITVTFNFVGVKWDDLQRSHV